MNILITGAARGLGLYMLLEAVKRGYHVYATVRDEVSKQLIVNTVAEHEQSLVSCFILDVKDEGQIEAAALAIKNSGKTIDVIINNAAILQATKTAITDLSYSDLMESFEVNLFGAMMVVKHFLPILTEKESKILNISSEAGSITNAYQDNYPYTLSKCAMNMFSEKLSRTYKNENKQVWSIHPGWMKTDMGGPNAALEVSYSATYIIDIADSTVQVESNQSFIDFKGKPMEI